MSRWIRATALCLLLGACAASLSSLAGYPGLKTKIRYYYANHASEENATCLAPEMRGITRVEVLEDTPERLVLRIRYYYQDDSYGEIDEENFTILRCRGFRTRTFVVDKRDGLRVVGMSGPVRDVRRNYN